MGHTGGGTNKCVGQFLSVVMHAGSYLVLFYLPCPLAILRFIRVKLNY